VTARGLEDKNLQAGLRARTGTGAALRAQHLRVGGCRCGAGAYDSQSLPTMRGYSRGGPYCVSDTYRIWIRHRYAADTYPSRTGSFEYLLAWIRVSDTFGPNWIRPMKCKRPKNLPRMSYSLHTLAPERRRASPRLRSADRRRLLSCVVNKTCK